MNNSRRGLFWVAIVFILVVGFLAVGRPSDTNKTPFDPRGTGPTGFKALVELIRAFGGEMVVVGGAPDSSYDVAFLPIDETDVADIAAIQTWVRTGRPRGCRHRLRFVPQLGSPVGERESAVKVDRGDCRVAALRDVSTIEVADAFAYRISSSSQHCFRFGSDAFVLVSSLGNGNIVALGSSSPLFNERLDQEDNAALAVALLAPLPGTRVAFLRGASARTDGSSIWDAVDPGVAYGFLLLGAAFAIYAWSRGRRLGKVILETPPVEIGGSELVVAVGQLLARSATPAHAAAALRDQARRDLAGRVGAHQSDSPAAIAAAYATRLGGDRVEVEALLSDTPVTDERELVTLAGRLHALREEVLSGKR